MKCTSISPVLVSVFVFFASCGRRESADVRKSGTEQPAEGVVVLAEVEGRRITLADFKAEVTRRGEKLFQTEEQRQRLLGELIAFEVLLGRAKAEGFDRTPNLQNQIDRLIVARFQERQFTAQQPRAPPGESELRAFYESHATQFTRPTELRAGLIYLPCSPKAAPEKRAELRKQAANVLEEARRADEAAFTLLAQRHSGDQATRYRGGDTGWVRADDDALPWPAAVLAAAVALPKSGDSAPLVETPNGFYIVRLLDQKPRSVRTFDEVKEAIAYELAQRQRQEQEQEFLQSMKQGMRIEVHPERLQLLSPNGPVVENAPPSVPGS